jgi:hypothetical protein
MADKGHLRKQLTPHRAPADDAGAEDTKLAAELAENVGKTVGVAMELGLSAVENVGLRMMELISPSKPAASAGIFGSVSSVLAGARKKAPKMSRDAATTLTDFVASRGLAALRAANRMARNTRRPG